MLLTSRWTQNKFPAVEVIFLLPRNRFLLNLLLGSGAFPLLHIFSVPSTTVFLKWVWSACQVWECPEHKREYNRYRSKHNGGAVEPKFTTVNGARFGTRTSPRILYVNDVNLTAASRPLNTFTTSWKVGSVGPSRATSRHGQSDVCV